MRSCQWALEMLRFLERTERRGFAWRVIDSNDETIVMFVPARAA
jgi:hypothetical protein